jgi:DNA-binding CsgD family transcriptional regulator
MAAVSFRSLMTSFNGSVKENPWLLMSFGLYWTWSLAHLLGPAFSDGGWPAIGDYVPVGLAAFGTCIVVCFAAAVSHRLYDRVAASRAFVPLQLASLITGVTGYLVWQVIDPGLDLARFAVSISGSVLGGGGTALFCLEVARPFRAVGHRKALYYGILSMLGGSAFAYLITLVPPVLTSVLMIAFPIPMVYCLRRSFGCYPKSELYIARPCLPRTVPYGLLVVASLHGLSIGGMFALLRNLGQTVDHFVNFVAFIVAVSILVLTALIGNLNFNHLVFRLGIPLLALGYLLASLLPAVPLVGNFLLYLGYCYLYLIICCLCVYLARIHRQSAIWIVGLGTGCLLAGQLAGEFIGSVFPAGYAAGFAVVMSFLLLLLAAILSGTDIASGWGSARPSAEDYLSTSIKSACDMVAGEFELSGREKDVLLLLVRGRTRRYVSQQLDVSEETVKSHTGKIYAKLSVHSHAELMNLIEKRACSITEISDSL